MTELIARPMVWLLGICYQIVGGYVGAIALFTLLTKVILFPISLWSHINSLKMVSLLPEINRLKLAYYGDKERIGEEQAALYKRERYHPLLSLLPLFLQIVILAGIREKMVYNDVPESFKGMPIVLITAGLMAIAFCGFSGLLWSAASDSGSFHGEAAACGAGAGAGAKPHQPIAAGAEQGGAVDNERNLHRNLPLPGGRCRVRRGDILDLLKPILHPEPARL